MKMTRKRIIIIVLVLAVISIGAYVGYSKANSDSPYAPAISASPYKVTALGKTYYPSAYGIKPDGILRIEVPDYGTGAIELGKDLKPIAIGKTNIMELPAGKWNLYDRITGKEIKFKGG